MQRKIKTPSDLKAAYEAENPEGSYFSRESMRFFGDTMKNYRVRGPVLVQTHSRPEVSAYELSRKNPVREGNQGVHYFDAETFSVLAGGVTLKNS